VAIGFIDFKNLWEGWGNNEEAKGKKNPIAAGSNMACGATTLPVSQVLAPAFIRSRVLPVRDMYHLFCHHKDK
jgi:hypothetical protein